MGVRVVGLEIARQKKTARQENWIIFIILILTAGMFTIGLWPHNRHVVPIPIHYSAQPVADTSSLWTI